MKVFITGGTGFIGTHLMKYLQNSDYDLLLLTLESEDLSNNVYLKNIKTVRGTLSNIDKWKVQVKRFQPDATIHMAWEGIPNYGYKTSVKNLEYGLKFITMLAELGCKRIICTGSCWEYGQKHGKLKEDMAPISTNAFTAAKNELNLMGKEIAKENNMSFIWTRLFYVYGPLQRQYSLIPSIIDCIQNGREPEIKTPNVKNDFIYVEDAVRAIFMILEKCNKSTIYNIGSGRSTSIKDIVELVCNAYDFQYKIESPCQTDGSPANFWADISRIKKDVGWEPEIKINEGVHKMINYYETTSR